MGQTIPHWLTKQAELAPNEMAIEMTDGTKITFQQLQIESQTLARKLATIGVSKGDHIGILSPNHPKMIILIHALSYLGATCVLLNTRLQLNEWQYQLDDADVNICFVHDEFLLKSKQLHGQQLFSFTEIEQVNQKKNVELATEIQLHDPFTIIYTSGTTGFPKGVIHTYGNHWWSAIASALNLGLAKHDKWLAVLPFFHVGGLSIFLRSVIYGIPVYLVEKFDKKVIHQAIMEKGVTIVSVVTVMLKKLLEELGETTYPSTFRCMLLGGGPAPKSLLERAKERIVPVFQSYGMTETSSQIVTLSPNDAFRKIGSSGKPLMPAQLRIANKNNDKIGEIYVKGPMVTNGYYKNDQANQDVFHGGWLATGDLGFLDDEGFLYVVDRRNDLIISGGENIYPSEVENVISSMEKVAEVGVTSKQDEEWGEVPVAFIVREDSALTEEEIITFCEGRLAKYKVPKKIYFVDQLPRNASNKLVRTTLKKWVKSDTCF